MADSEVYLNIQNIIKMLPETLAKGLEVAGQLIENVSKENCPVDDGQLKASITHDVDIDNSKVTIGSNLEYAPYVHFGTGIYAKNGDGRQTPWTYQSSDGEFHKTKGQKPQPFLQDAIDNNMDKIPKLFENLLDRQGE